MTDVDRRNPQEVDVRWLRMVMMAGAALLLVSLVIYEDADPNGAGFDLLDPGNVRYKMWDGGLRGPDWAAMFNGIAGASYVVPAFGLQGRVGWRGVVTAVLVTAGLAVTGIALLVHLMVTDPASFPIGSAGMARILLGHGIAGAGLVLMWRRLRRAAKT